MRSLTVKQPWASLIVHRIKDIENRTWPTKYRGRVLIHAGATIAGHCDELLNDSQYTKMLESGILEYPKSAIIGSVEIVDCVINHPSIWAEKSDKDTCFYDEFTGMWHPITGRKPTHNWVLANPILFDEPILNVKGKLSFWDYDGLIPENL